MTEKVSITLYAPLRDSSKDDYPVMDCPLTRHLSQSSSEIVNRVQEIDDFLANADPFLLKLAKRANRLERKKLKDEDKYNKRNVDNVPGYELDEGRRTKMVRDQVLDSEMTDIFKKVDPKWSRHSFSKTPQRMEQFKDIQRRLQDKCVLLSELHQRRIK